MQNQTQNLNQNSDQNNQNKNTFLSSLTAKIILAIIIFAGSAIIIISGAKFIIENYRISINKIIKSQCEIDSDCQMVYVGFGPCPPCDYLSKEYQCLNESEKIKIWNERIERNKSKPITACSPCAIEPDRYICECKNWKCEKVKEESVEEIIIITTDKTEYSTNDKINIKIINNFDLAIFFVGPLDCPASLKFFGYNNSNNIWQDITPKWECLTTKEKMIFNESINLDFDLKYFFNLSYDKYRLEFVYSLKEFKRAYNNPRELIAEADKVYSNEFTIKEKSALDPRCSERVKGIGSCKMSGIGHEFDSSLEKCVEKRVGGCSFEMPFETLEECQKICEEEQINILDSQNVITANNQFAFDLYDKYKLEQGNIFFSPYSISTALAMTYEGARSKTAEEMQSVFYFPKDNSGRRNGYLSLYNQINKQDKEYQLSTANALWAQKDYRFLDKYFNITEKYYNGKVTNLDFIKETEKSRITINNWVEDKTNDKIKNLIPQGALNQLTRLVLTNAIYFKGNWVKQFNEEDTKEQNFTTDSGKIVKVQMMQRTDDEAKFNYTETNEAQILEMSYDGDDLSILVILPTKNNLSKIEKLISLEKLSEWRNKIKEQRVNIYIPKFKFETKYFMKEDLKQMGMPTAFSMNADFSGMTGNRDLFISDVIHQAFVEVNEEGTEAAAATAVVMELESVSVEPVIPTFFADHSFIFIIQEKETGNILFMGRVGDPSE